MKNVYELEKALTAKGYKTSVASYGANGCYDTYGNFLPDCFRDCLVIYFRVCDGAENDVSKESDFLKYLNRHKEFTIYDSYSVYAGGVYIITDKASAAELYADAKVKKMVLDEFWRIRHEAYLNQVSA